VTAFYHTVSGYKHTEGMAMHTHKTYTLKAYTHIHYVPILRMDARADGFAVALTFGFIRLTLSPCIEWKKNWRNAKDEDVVMKSYTKETNTESKWLPSN